MGCTHDWHPSGLQLRDGRIEAVGLKTEVEAGSSLLPNGGANLPEDAIYPVNLGDETGKPLDGANKYALHFEKGATPPADAFWSVTLYDSEGFQVANALNRFNLASWMPLKSNADGSLDLYFQNESPGANKEANWLPAPKGPLTC
jgi:hypothetical protein